MRANVSALSWLPKQFSSCNTVNHLLLIASIHPHNFRIRRGKLERFVADWARENHIKPEGAKEKKDKKVAVIGSGPPESP